VGFDGLHAWRTGEIDELSCQSPGSVVECQR